MRAKLSKKMSKLPHGVHGLREGRVVGGGRGVPRDVYRGHCAIGDAEQHVVAVVVKGHAQQLHQQVDPQLQQSLARSTMHDLVVSGHKFGTGTQSIVAQLPIVF